MKYLFDTNTILFYFKDSMITRLINEELNPLFGNHISLISVVTVGEIESIILK
jgi:predicted nucleic acid-binding protein